MRLGTKMTMMMGLLATTVLPACGSSWTLRGKLPVGCILKNFHVDEDGDGWGKADSNSQPLCDGNTELKLTASNDIDCDDDEREVTGRTGALCPDGLLAGGVDYRGITIAESEFIAVHSESAVVRFTEATLACDDWAGMNFIFEFDDEGEKIEDAEGNPIVELEDAGGLATFDANADIVELENVIWGEVKFNEPGIYAGWIGIGWKENVGRDTPSTNDDDAGDEYGIVCKTDGEVCDSNAPRGGVWGWVDDSPQELVHNFFDFCPDWGRDGPHIADFWPDLNMNDKQHRKEMEEQLENVRLALVYLDTGEWCLGLPIDAIPFLGGDDTNYDVRSAHMICERDTPDPSNFESLAIGQ